MNLIRAVIHEIIKQPQVIDATSFLSASLLPVNQETIRLAQVLNNAFSKDNNSYGDFEQTDDSFYEHYLDHRNHPTDESFLHFTSVATNMLCEILRNTFFAKGGFFVFCEYESNSIPFTGVYLVRDVEGMLFNKDSVNRTFRINQIKYLDTNRLAMGARIHINKFTDGDHNHVALTRSIQSDISDYFINWIGITRPESNADFTNKLFQLISSVERPINPNTENEYSVNEIRQVVFDLVKSAPDKVVNVRNISSVIYGNEDILISYAEANGFEMDYEFRYDGRALNKFRIITAKRDGISLSFARGDLDTKVFVSTEERDLVSIRSRRLADSLREQISQQ